MADVRNKFYLLGLLLLALILAAVVHCQAQGVYKHGLAVPAIKVVMPSTAGRTMYWTCTEKERVLLRTEDGEMYCLNVKALEAIDGEGK